MDAQQVSFTLSHMCWSGLGRGPERSHGRALQPLPCSNLSSPGPPGPHSGPLTQRHCQALFGFPVLGLPSGDASQAVSWWHLGLALFTFISEGSPSRWHHWYLICFYILNWHCNFKMDKRKWMLPILHISSQIFSLRFKISKIWQFTSLTWIPESTVLSFCVWICLSIFIYIAFLN